MRVTLNSCKSLVSVLNRVRKRYGVHRRTREWRRSRLGFETLESRELLSASRIGPEFQVNSYTTSAQFLSSVAMDADGDFVVTWISNGQDGDGYGIYAQLHNAVGGKQGVEFRVNTTTASYQTQPAVAMDADGDFVVVWQGIVPSTTSIYDIYAQRYKAAGIPQGSEFQVNSNERGVQSLSSVAMDADGDFVVVWQSFGSDSGGGFGISAQRYNASGVREGNEFRVNSTFSSDQALPSVAMDANGDFVVAWQSNGQDGNGYGIYAQRYNASGVVWGSEFRVNTTTANNQTMPSAAMDADGDFVIAWESNLQDGSGKGIYAQRYSSLGVKEGGEMPVNTFKTDDQSEPEIAMDVSGDFVVTWNSFNQDGDRLGVYGQRYSSAGVKQGGEFQVNSTEVFSQGHPSVSMDADGDFVITWHSSTQDGSNYGVYAQRYNETTTTAGPMVTEVREGSRRIAPGGRLNTSIGELTVAFSERLNVTGGTTGANSVLNRANWRLTRDGVDVSTLITQIAFAFNNQTGKHEAKLTLGAAQSGGTYRLTALDTIRNLHGNALDGNVDGTPGGNYDHSFAIEVLRSAGQEFRVNSFTASAQSSASVAMDGDGDFVIVWQSREQDGSDYGIYAQRYDAAGAKRGDEFLVNTTTTFGQLYPSVAMSATGDFVISWTGLQDGNNYSILARRYNEDGLARGDEFQVNSYTVDAQWKSSVAMDADGNFVIVWQSNGQDDGLSAGIYGQRYHSAGVKRGGEFRVNTYTTQGQINPSVAMDVDGDFVVTWESEDQDGSGWGIYGQRYDSAGRRQGDEFRINTTTTGLQISTRVAMDAAGNFVVTWVSGTSTDFDVYARRFNAAGIAQGNEFRVNTVALNRQFSPDVAMDEDGDFVIAWYSSVSASDYELYAQRYNASGIPKGGEFRTNSFLPSYQMNADLAMDSEGDFVIAWQSDTQDGDWFGIYAQRYQNVTPISLSGGVLSVTGSNTFDVMSVDVVAPAGSASFFQVVRNGVNYLVDPTQVTSIQLIGLGGSDRLSIGRNVDRPSTLSGDSGNDILTGGGGADRLLGGADDDTYVFDTDIPLGSDTINDISGIDTLNFSSTTGRRVFVNLSILTSQVVNGGLTLTLSSDSSIENVNGGELSDILIGNSLTNTLNGNGGDDVLSGQAGSDILIGGLGKNILIGGDGADQLTGGASEDLLIGARYIYGNSYTALDSILREWTSAGSYGDRVGHLLGTLAGGLQGTYTLTRFTVKEDRALDRMIGGSRRDWYFRNSRGTPTTLRDIITDADVDSVFTEIDTWL
jgi:Ca2+-binding RTX toxin-like protein